MRTAALLASWLSLVLAPAAHAADTPPKPAAPKSSVATPPSDEELEWLEFLGSIDAASDDADWLDFLRTTDIGKVVKNKPAANRPEGKSK